MIDSKIGKYAFTAIGLLFILVPINYYYFKGVTKASHVFMLDWGCSDRVSIRNLYIIYREKSMVRLISSMAQPVSLINSTATL